MALRAGALPEIVDHGKTGFIVDSVTGLAEALRQVGTLSPQACREAALSRFAACVMADRYLELYSRMIAQPTNEKRKQCGGKCKALEFPLYHAAVDGSMIAGRFVGEPQDEEVLALTPEEQALKRRMLDCFPSQADFLRRFPLHSERFRPMTAHDFTKSPHPGPLLYERWGWGISGESWRQRAGQALALLS
ncbi:MAG: hypothetical protein ABI759_11270 [Candidatus Solibacter sp.]